MELDFAQVSAAHQDRRIFLSNMLFLLVVSGIWRCLVVADTDADARPSWFQNTHALFLLKMLPPTGQS